jgi:hypothetical protein
MTRRTWLRNMFNSRSPRTIRKEQARHRPFLEELEDRCLLNGDPNITGTPTIPGTTSTNTIFWNGLAPLPNSPWLQNNGPSNIAAPPQKTITIQNTTDKTIYPFLTDGNDGKAPNDTTNPPLSPNPANPANYYDPFDAVGTATQYREYVGYVGKTDGNWYLGLPAKATVTIQVPLVFWDGARLYIATDGTDLIDQEGTSINPFAYDASASASRGVSLFSSTNSWVTNFAAPNNNASDALVMFYSTATKGLNVVPNAAAPAQLDEITIRDPKMNQWLVSQSQTVLLFDYDVSAVDGLSAPVSIEASNITIPTVGTQKNFGWAGSQLPSATMQSDMSLFTNPLNNASNPNTVLGQYFGGSSWPKYYNPIQNDIAIPSGYNLFLNSPLNNVRSPYDNNLYTLTTGGAAQINAGGPAVTTQNPTQLSLTLNVPNENALAAQLKSRVQAGGLNWTISTAPSATAGMVTAYYPTNTVIFFRKVSGGTGYTAPIKYKLTGGGTTTSATGTALANVNGSITQVGLPRTSTGGIPLYTSVPSFDITSGGGTGADIRPDIGGTIQGIAVPAGMGGTGYPNKVSYKLTGGGQPTASGTAVAKSGVITQVNLPSTGGGGIYTSAPSLTFTSSTGSGAQAYVDIGGGTVAVTNNKTISLTPGKLYSYIFSGTPSDYAATDIMNLWYSWGDYYYQQMKNVTQQSLPGSIQANSNVLTLNGSIPDSLALGMTVNGPGIVAAGGTQVTVLGTNPSMNQIYLSQLSPTGGSSTTGDSTTNYMFGAPQPLPFANSDGVQKITVTNQGSGYAQPATVSFTDPGGKGTGAAGTVITSNTQVTSVLMTNFGSGYDSNTQVTISGGGGVNATGKPIIQNGALTGVTIGNMGSGYLSVDIGGAGKGATAVPVVTPATVGSTTGPITSIAITNGGTGYSGSWTVNINGGGAAASGATANATAGTYFKPVFTTLTQTQSFTPKDFAASVYGALITEATAPGLTAKIPTLWAPMSLVATTIGTNAATLPNSTLGTNLVSTLSGEFTNLIISILRGVPNYTDTRYSDPSLWYPNPSLADTVNNIAFNEYNLDPYVWFLHSPPGTPSKTSPNLSPYTLGTSAYAFSVDDGVGNVIAGGPVTGTAPKNIQVVFGGPPNDLNNLPQYNKQAYFPTLNWGMVGPTQGTISYSDTLKAYVLTLDDSTAYNQITYPSQNQIGAYVSGGSIPSGTIVTAKQPTGTQAMVLSTTATLQTGGGQFTFTGTPMSPPPPPPPLSSPPPSPPPPNNNQNNQGGGGFANFSSTTQQVVSLTQDELLLTLTQVASLIEQAFGLNPDPTLASTLAAYQSAILANPLSQTPLGQELINLIQMAILNLLLMGGLPI